MMRYLFIIYYLFFYICKLNLMKCLRTNFQCTTSSSALNVDNNDYSSSNENYQLLSNSRTLKLDCKNDLIYIVWSHYGHQYSKDYQIFNKNSRNNTCNFSVNDCMVNVDYVANECNGLTSCQISLDTQYLHSCKAYSDYIFILYECIDASKTVNICNDVNIQTSDPIYIQATNYPNEYNNNLNCNCVIETSGNQIKFQLLEFDLESSYDSEINLFKNNFINDAISNNNKCSKDYLSINNSKYCGTIGSYVNFYTKPNVELNSLNLKFITDDALTRRGFWIKIKGLMFDKQCPEDFFLVENKCIKIYNNLLTWFESKKFCSNLGYELVTIDDFEVDKQFNRFLDDNIKFWFGLKHLNGTNWFNEDNQVINVDQNQQSWWPWLEFDNLLYNQGSCVAKHKHGLVLEDCYQRLKFACQYRLKTTTENELLSLKCGKNSYITNKLSNQKFNSNSSSSSSLNNNYKKTNDYLNKIKNNLQINQKSKLSSSSSSLSLNQKEKLSNTEDNKKLIDLNKSLNNYKILTEDDDTKEKTIEINNSYDNSSVNNNSTLVERVYITNKFYPDSTLFITLISSIIILIAFVNFVVIMILCRRRKFHKEEQQHQHDYNLHGHSRQQQISKLSHQLPASSLNSDHISYATTTESSDFLTFNSNSIKQQYPFQHQQQHQQNYLNNHSTASTSSSIIDRSDIMILNRTSNENPSVHVYETISMYGKNNEYQHTRLADPEFYNNLLIFPNNTDDILRQEEDPVRRLSTKLISDNNNNNKRSFKQPKGFNNKNNDKPNLTTFYNNFNEDNRIIRNSNNNFSNDLFNDIKQPCPNTLFINHNNNNNRTQNRLLNGFKSTSNINQNIFPTEAAVV